MGDFSTTTPFALFRTCRFQPHNVDAAGQLSRVELRSMLTRRQVALLQSTYQAPAQVVDALA